MVRVAANGYSKRALRESRHQRRRRHTVRPIPPISPVSYELTRQGRTFGELAEAIERWGHELVEAERPRPR